MLAALPDELSAMTNPPVGAGEFMVTVPAVPEPPITVAGLMERPVRAGGLTVRLADTETVVSVAVMVATFWVLTARVVTVKVALFCPAGTVTDEGRATFLLLDCKLTTTPPAGAAFESVTVPVDVAPPKRLVGLRVTDVRVRIEKAYRLASNEPTYTVPSAAIAGESYTESPAVKDQISAPVVGLMA